VSHRVARRVVAIAIIGTASLLLLPTATRASDDAKVSKLAGRNRAASVEEFVSLQGSTPLQEALGILSALARKTEGRVIINLSKANPAIGVDIINMPWLKAFEIVCRSNGLTYKVFQDHYLVRTAEGTQAGGEGVEQLSADRREVMISATFFEADRKRIREAGVDWLASFTGSASGSAELSAGEAVSEELFQLEGAKDLTSSLSLTAYLRALESENIGEIIASPQVTVLSGQQGRIQVGTDFSIKTRDFAGNVIDNFFSTGTILTVEPDVIETEGLSFVHLKIEAERSSAIPDAVSTQIKKNQASTHVFLLDGEETALAGLFSAEELHVRKGIPFLKDLPWWFLGIRYLAGYERKETTEKELVIVLGAELLPTLHERLEAKKREARASNVRAARERLHEMQQSVREAIDAQDVVFEE
jgi:type IV pilus assembly protein PilQ